MEDGLVDLVIIAQVSGARMVFGADAHPSVI